MIAREARLLQATQPKPFEQLGNALESMVQIQMKAYPSHWSDEDRREMAEQHLFGGSDAQDQD